MNKKEFHQNIKLIIFGAIMGAILSLIGAVIGGVTIHDLTKDKSPHLIISFSDTNGSANEIYVDVVNVNDFSASGLWGVYDKEQEIPIYDKDIEFSQSSINKNEIVRGVLDLSYLDHPSPELCDNSLLNNESYVNCGGFTVDIPIKIYCKNCDDKDITYLDNYALVSYDTFCKLEGNHKNCDSKMSLVSFI